MYDMKPMAQSLASQGRYGDTMLVHMNPVEVAGLDAYTRKMGGGGLTVNPRTGQPEAFLPFLLGLGLQGLGMTALQAGLATGIGTAVATKDLGKGVLAGLGAFGGADVGAGLGAAGATAAQQVLYLQPLGADIVRAHPGASIAQSGVTRQRHPASGSLLHVYGSVTSDFASPTWNRQGLLGPVFLLERHHSPNANNMGRERQLSPI
jgi:hypothetical protein